MFLATRKQMRNHRRCRTGQHDVWDILHFNMVFHTSLECRTAPRVCDIPRRMWTFFVVILDVLVQLLSHPLTLVLYRPVDPLHLSQGLGMIPPGQDVLYSVFYAPPLEGTHSSVSGDSQDPCPSGNGRPSCARSLSLPSSTGP